MKILPVVTNTRNIICRNIKTTYSRFNDAQKNGDEIAVRAASIYGNAENLGKYKRVMKVKKTIQEITPYNLPVIGAIIGTAIPIIGTTPLFIILGFIGSGGLIAYDKLKSVKHKIK